MSNGLPPPPPGFGRYSPKYRAMLQKLTGAERRQYIMCGREREMWVYYSVLEFHGPVSPTTKGTRLVQVALDEEDVDKLEYLMEFIEIGPIEDEVADPVRYKMLSRCIEVMRAQGVVDAIEARLKSHDRRLTTDGGGTA